VRLNGCVVGIGVVIKAFINTRITPLSGVAHDTINHTGFWCTTDTLNHNYITIRALKLLAIIYSVHHILGTTHLLGTVHVVASKHI
jgi:hypothetical protein